MSITPIPDSLPVPVLKAEKKEEEPLFLSPRREFQVVVRPLDVTPSRFSYSRPSWWDKSHRLLRELAAINRERPISQIDIKSVEETGDLLIEKGDSSEMLLFMKMLSQFYFVGAKKIFFKVLNEIRSIVPEVNAYFKDVDIDEDDEGPIFSKAGIEKIFKIFENEFGYPSGILDSCLTSELPSMIEEIIQSGEEGKMQGWVVENDLLQDDPHVVPIFAIKIKGKTHVFVFDSLGHLISDEGKTRCSISAGLEELIKYFSDTESIDRHLALYSYKNKRQNGWALDCVTFASLDLKHLLERHISGSRNIVDFYLAQENDHRIRPIGPLLGAPRLPIYELNILPPEMMKGTQSLRGIREYQNNAPCLSPDLIPSFERYSPSWEISREIQTLPHLLETVTDSERMNVDNRPMNHYIERKRLSYIVYLLGLHLREEKIKKISHPRELFPPEEDDSNFRRYSISLTDLNPGFSPQRSGSALKMSSLIQ